MSKAVTINKPGDAHALTFSCQGRLPLLASDEAKLVFLRNLDRARKKHAFDVWAYVVMPEHVHLVVYPRRPVYSIEAFRRSVKQPTAMALLPIIRKERPGLAERLVGPAGNYRFWLKGKGHDRNLFSDRAIHSEIAYLHANPVRRGLCEIELDYLWSSAGFYYGAEDVPFAVDRCPVVNVIVPGR
jgi:putative transposase